jgi:hypothetical protein
VKKPCKTCGKEKTANRTKFSEFSYRKDRKRYYNDCKACRNIKRAASEKIRKRKVVTQEQEAIARNPHGFLAADIIEKAIRDWKKYKDVDVQHRELTDYGEIRAMVRQKGFATIREELLAFFASAWFEELAGMSGSDAEYLRKHILEL